VWEPEDFGGLAKIVVYPHRMWAPKLATGNRFVRFGHNRHRHHHHHLLWSPYVIGQTIIFSSCFFLLSSFILLFFISSPNLSGQRLDVYDTSTQGVALVRIWNAGLKMCCTWLAENTGRKNDAKNRHLGTIPQLCRAISPQLMHVSTIGKKLVKQQYLLHMCPQYGELRPTIG